MWIGGDPDDLARLAQRLRGLAETVACDRAAVQARLDACHWESVSADAFRQKVADDLRDYDQVVVEIDEAAQALDVLAQALTESQHNFLSNAVRLGRVPADLWAEVSSDVENIVSGVGHLVGSLW